MAKPQTLFRAFDVLRGNMLVLTVTRALGMFCRGMVFPYASLYILSLGGAPEQVGWINSISPLAGLLMFPLAGHLADRAGRVRLIALAGYLSALIGALYVFAQGWQAIALARFLQGFMVFQFPPTSAIIADSLAPHNRGRGMATMNTIASAVGIAAPYIAGALLDEEGVTLGMRVLYGVMVVYNIVAATVHLRFLKETTTPARAQRASVNLLGQFKRAYGDIPSTLRQLSPTLRALAGVLVLGFVGNGIAGAFWVVYAQDVIGLSASTWGLILLIESALRSLMYIPAGWAVDRWGRTRCILGALVLGTIAVPGFVFAHTFAQVLAIRVVMAVVAPFFVTASSALLADLVPRDMRGRVMAALGRGTVFIGASSGGTGGPGVGFVITIPLMIASFAGGYLYAAAPRLPWYFAGGALVASLLLVALFVRDPETAQA